MIAFGTVEAFSFGPDAASTEEDTGISTFSDMDTSDGVDWGGCQQAWRVI
jgi:hypothetical protein